MKQWRWKLAVLKYRVEVGEVDISKFWNVKTAAAIVGILAVIFGLSDAVESEILNNVIIAGGALAALYGKVTPEPSE